MKIMINNEECKLNILNHFMDKIKSELDFENYEDMYDFLLKKYNKILLKNGLSEYKESLYFERENTAEDKIFSLFCHMNMESPFTIYSTINNIAKKTNKYYLSLFVILDHRINLKKDVNYSSIMVVKKEDLLFLSELLTDAYNENLLVDRVSLTEALFKTLNKDKLSELKEDKKLNFINEIKNGLDNIEYISFEDSDEYLNHFSIYKKNINIKYKEILLSSEFNNYVKDSEINSDTIVDFEEFFSDFLESCDIDFKDLICRKIIKDDENLTEDHIKTLKINAEPLF